MTSIILIFAPKRSGHHAFINSLMSGNEEPILFLNNPPLNAKSWFPRQYIVARSELRLQSNHSFADSFSAVAVAQLSNGLFWFPDVPAKPALRQFLVKQAGATLLVNFEDCLPDSTEVQAFCSLLEEVFPAAEFSRLHFMRDPRNLIASRLVRTPFYQVDDKGEVSMDESDVDAGSQRGQKILQQLRDIVGANLEMSLSEADSSLYRIDYASWLSDESYRVQHDFAKILNINIVEKAETMHGKGSSFSTSSENRSLSGYLERYKKFDGTPIYDDLIASLEPMIGSYQDQRMTGVAKAALG